MAQKGVQSIHLRADTPIKCPATRTPPPCTPRNVCRISRREVTCRRAFCSTRSTVRCCAKTYLFCRRWEKIRASVASRQCISPLLQPKWHRREARLAPRLQRFPRARPWDCKKVNHPQSISGSGDDAKLVSAQSCVPSTPCNGQAGESGVARNAAMRFQMLLHTVSAKKMEVFLKLARNYVHCVSS